MLKEAMLSSNSISRVSVLVSLLRSLVTMYSDIYINIIIHVKLFMNVKNISEEENERIKLLQFYDLLLTHSDFKNIDKNDFYEVQKKIKNQRRQRKMLNVKLLEQFSFLDFSSVKEIFDD